MGVFDIKWVVLKFFFFDKTMFFHIKVSIFVCIVFENFFFVAVAVTVAAAVAVAVAVATQWQWQWQ
jgi:hypothetical protein